jgi:UDP-3-O-[3-hydroxymyristoyl] N-acetylglucosamine deacetylase
MDGFHHGATLYAPAHGLEFAADPTTQATLKAAIDCVGIGLHSGARVALALRPAPADHGIVFRRRDLGLDIPARFDLVADTRLCTVLAHPQAPQARVATVEHLMAAFAATGVTNALVELDGPELPIHDGSAQNFIFLIDCAGIAPQDTPRAAIAVMRPVRVEGEGGAFAELTPSRALAGLEAEIAIDFAAPAIGAQSLALPLTGAAIRQELAAARTFCLLQEVEAMQAAGLARGGSLDNAVVVDNDRILNPAGLRMEREFVRHKMLDVAGDLALSGVTLHATLHARKPGHALNNQLLRALFADPANWRQVEGTRPLEFARPKRATPA